VSFDVHYWRQMSMHEERSLRLPLNASRMVSDAGF
jgi:hypothetical protein